MVKCYPVSFFNSKIRPKVADCTVRALIIRRFYYGEMLPSERFQ
jgi:hypothetical protein